MTTVGVGGLCDAVFSQGDKGTSWYIIWKGSVNVITHGKVIWSKRACVYCHVVMELDSRRGVCTQGLVTTLHEGEDFGQLALLNDAPRAATIILREDNCHFLRVDKQDFIRILKVWSHLRPFCAQRKEQSGRHTLFFCPFQDVEANTVRLQEHGKTVLVLEKSSDRAEQTGAGNNSK